MLHFCYACLRLLIFEAKWDDVRGVYFKTVYHFMIPIGGRAVINMRKKNLE